MKLFKLQSEFKIGATSPSHFPVGSTPEFAFIGRSNVGKSSLLNALVGRRNLARASQAPGRTRQINFFLLGGQIFLVDLPGYGYAKASKKEINAWSELIKYYLMERANLKRLFLLVDSRHGLKVSDLEMIEFLDSCAVTVQIVLTKIDKLNPIQVPAIKADVEEALHKYAICMNEVIACSSESKEGIEELQASIMQSLGI